MAKIVLTLLDGKVLTRDTKVIGSESGCCCCFCSETCERCIITDVEFSGYGNNNIGPPIYQMLDKTAYAPDPPYCAEIRIVVSHTTAEWYNGTDEDGDLFSNYFLNTVGEYAEEVEENGNKKYKTYQKHCVLHGFIEPLAQRAQVRNTRVALAPEINDWPQNGQTS